MKLQEQLNRIQEMMGVPNGNLITEGRYSAVLNDVTKDVMKEIITFIQDDNQDTLEWENYYIQESFLEKFDINIGDEETQEQESFVVIVNAEKIDEEHPYNIDAYQEWDDDLSVESIVVNLEINPEEFKGRTINEFQAELKDMFRHEIEHLYQSVNPNKRVKYIKTKSFVKDVLQPAEIDAYIHGFYTQAKTKKVTMNQIIDEWIEQRQKHFKNKKDMDKVRIEFIKHGKKLYPKAKWL